MIGARTAVVFGGSGFLGHAVVQLLAAQGLIVRVPTRDPEKAKDLKVLGAPGQIVPFALSVRSDAAVTQAIAGADIVVNLIGILAEKGRDTFQTMHVETAARIARIARASDVPHFVHVSALGADAKAASAYARTKAQGEDAVRAFFPAAVILRPSVLFGPRDRFLMRFANLARFVPFLPLIGGGKTLFQPVSVGDVAAAVWAGIEKPEAKGKIFALGGPKIYSFKELMLLLLAALGIKRFLLPVPWSLAKIDAFFLEKLPDPLLTRDQVELLKTDNIVPHAPGAFRTFEALGIEPVALEPMLLNYVTTL